MQDLESGAMKVLRSKYKSNYKRETRPSFVYKYGTPDYDDWYIRFLTNVRNKSEYVSKQYDYIILQFHKNARLTYNENFGNVVYFVIRRYWSSKQFQENET